MTLGGCEKEIKFNGDETSPKMVAYTMISVDSTRHTIELTESKPIFFERESEIFNIPPPEIKVNGNIIPLDDEIKTTDKAIYTFSADISDGDKVEFFSQTERYGTVKATDILPRSAVIKEIKTSWFQSSYVNCLRANITIEDIKGEDNFYRVIIQTKKDESHNEWNGEWQTKEIFTDQEPLFSKIPITLEDHFPDLSYRIFSDGTFKDSNYTLNLYFNEDTMSPVNLPPYGGETPDDYVPIYDGQHYIRVEIQTISEPLYRYLHSLELQSNQDYTMEPIKIYSNVKGGYGVISSYNLTDKTKELKY